MKRTEEKVTPVLIDKNWNRFLFNLEVAKNLNKLRRMKIEAEYRSVDVTDTKKVSDAIKDIEKQSFTEPLGGFQPFIFRRNKK